MTMKMRFIVQLYPSVTADHHTGGLLTLIPQPETPAKYQCEDALSTDLYQHSTSRSMCESKYILIAL